MRQRSDIYAPNLEGATPHVRITYESVAAEAALLLTIEGECDLAGASLIDRILAELVETSRASPGHIELDLSRVTFIDTAGLEPLEGHLGVLLAAGWSIEISATSRVFERLTGIVDSPLRHLHRGYTDQTEPSLA